MAERYEFEESSNGNTLCRKCHNSLPKGRLMWHIGCFGYKYPENVNICASCIIEMYKKNVNKKTLARIKEDEENRIKRQVARKL